MDSDPLISAIMPTHGRRDLATEALRMFQAQDYARKEIVIVDDVADRSFPIAPTSDNVVYLLAPRLTIGQKRNVAVSAASGDIIAHWDSDDWYAPDRLSHQLMLLNYGWEITGYNPMDFEDLETGERYLYRAESPRYAVGVSLCYRRSAWEKRQFEPKNKAEDNAFIRERSLLAVPAEGRIVARLHNGNTAEKRSEIAKYPHAWIRKERVAARAVNIECC